MCDMLFVVEFGTMDDNEDIAAEDLYFEYQYAVAFGSEVIVIAQ